MNWDAISAVAETIGVIAVFASLLYLAKQVKTGNDHIRTDTFRSIMQGMGNYCNDMFSLENAELIEKGFLSFPTLSPYEKVRFDNLMAHYFNYAEDSFLSSNVKLLGDETMQNYIYWLQSRFFAYEGVRDWWQFGKAVYPPDFQSWIESIIESTDTTQDVYGFSDPVQPSLDQVYDGRLWPNPEVAPVYGSGTRIKLRFVSNIDSSATVMRC